MYRIDNDTAISTLPTPAAVGPNPDYYFTEGDAELGVPATIVDADWANAVQEELCAVIEGAGLTLDKTNQSQLFAAIKLIIAGGGGDYVASTTAANTYTATLTPAPSAYAAGQFFTVKFTNHNTGAATINFNSLGAASMKRVDGSALSAYDIYDSMVAILIYDGTNFILCNPHMDIRLQNDASNYSTSADAANTYTTTLSPAPLAYSSGMRLSIKFTNANTGAATINANSLGAKAIVLGDQTALSGGEIAAGMIADLRYDGTSFILCNPANSNVTKTAIQNQSYVYAASTTAANTYTATITPAPTAYATGQRFLIKFTNTNTATCTINLNSLGAITITRTSGAALVGGEIESGMIADLIYDGTNFQLLNPAPIAPSVTVYTSGSGTYTTPTGAKYLEVHMVGAGGGGGAGVGASNTGASGGNTTFGTLTATGGSGGQKGVLSNGGASSGSNGDANLNGGIGSGCVGTYNGSGYSAGGSGGVSYFGGGGQGIYQTAGGNGTAPGSGGAGGADTGAQLGGHGGNAGGYVFKIISSPSASYSYAVGAGGAGGAAASSGLAGGTGAAGLIIVKAHYQ